MVVRSGSKMFEGKFMTQRVNPKLALIEVGLPVEALEGGWGQLPPDAALVLTAPGMEPISVQLSRPGGLEAKPTSASCWEWEGSCLDEGEEVARWLTEFMGLGCRLVRYAGEGTAMGDGWRRPVEKGYGEDKYETAFSDGFPILLASEESLAAINEGLGDSPVAMSRFRPNIVVRGAPAWAEDRWESIRLSGGPEFKLIKPCTRCTVTTVDPETAEFDPTGNALAHLKTFRRGDQLDWGGRKWRAEVFFAWNIVTDAPPGTRISTGGGVEPVGDRHFVRPKKEHEVTDDECDEDSSEEDL
mmetsp:Transcript_70158/g.222443  ORF Transcript_70158/g.222443 Transcript_70158/m.222443 type:complete len:300 (-) Transcript_70158:619-1518(-)